MAVTVRLFARLRELVGEDSYQSATLPPNVPTWRFNEMR